MRKGPSNFKIVFSHVNDCNEELQMLSRYLIVQKLAVKKLLRRLISSHDGSAVVEEWVTELYQSDDYQNGYQGVSFAKLDLDPYLIEISLIVDVLNDLKLKVTTNNNNDVSSTLLTSKHNETLNLRSNENPPSIQNNGEDIIRSAIDFDTIFMDKCLPLHRLIVSNENIEEFKFMLLSNEFRIVDDQLISTSKDIIVSTEQNRPNLNVKKSMASIRSFQTFQSSTKQRNNSATSTSHGGLPSLRLSQNMLSISLLDLDPTGVPRFMKDDAFNQSPTLLIHLQDTNISPNCILMCHMGGLRDHLVTNNIPLEVINQVLSQDVKGSIPPSNSNFNPIDNMALEWIMNQKLRHTGMKIDIKRTRLIFSTEEFTYLISIDEKICITFNDEKFYFPHSIVEIKLLSKKSPSSMHANNINNPTKSMNEKLQHIFREVYEKNIQCFSLDRNWTLWKICYSICQLPNVNDNDLFKLLLQCDYTLPPNDSLSTEEFFALGHDGILELCYPPFQEEIRNKSQSQSTHSNFKPHPYNESKANKQKERTFRYWNEFDDDQASINRENQHFYQDEDESICSQEDHGLVTFNRPFIDSMFDKFKSIKSMIIPRKRKQRKKRQQDGTSIYGSTYVLGSRSTLTLSPGSESDLEASFA